MLHNHFAVVPFVLLACTSSAAAWSGPSHEAIAAAAQTQLTPGAKLALAQVLQETSSLSEGALAAVATWPDDLRARARFHTIAEGWGAADVAEADQFNTDHPDNAGWHFVDLPLGASGYPATDPSAGDPMRPFVLSNDIVHALRQCIAILEAPTAPPTFSKRQAVRWIVHLVGDLHQPMHVTSGYYKTNLASFTTHPVRIVDPVKAGEAGVLNDRGTNGLLFSATEGNNLHATWDRCLPGQVSGASCSSGPNGFTPLAVKLTTWLTPSAVSAAATPGDHHGWPAAWASDVLHTAVTHHVHPTNLKNGKVKPGEHGEPDSVPATIGAPTKTVYLTGQKATAQAQLVTAAARLGALFNAIAWP